MFVDLEREEGRRGWQDIEAHGLARPVHYRQRRGVALLHQEAREVQNGRADLQERVGT